MRELGEDGKTVNFNELNVNGHKIRDLRYADDTILLSHGTSGLSHLVESVDKHSSEKCLKLNAKKTKLMKTDKSKEDLEIKVDSLSGIYSIWRRRWNRGNKKEARYGNKQAVGTKMFVEWSRSSNQIKKC